MKKQESINISRHYQIAAAMIVLLNLLCTWAWASPPAEKPRHGGTLIFVIRHDPPSFDAHQETTIETVHPFASNYNLLIKYDPEGYPKIVGDLAESWTISGDHKKYTFKIHKGVKFHDGSLLTAKDIKASYDKIIFPPPGIHSPRKPLYDFVDKVEATDDHTVVFTLKWPTQGTLDVLASPWNWIYKAEILSRDPHWYEKNAMGTGPFKFEEYVSGSHFIGKRNKDYFVKGLPYLDGYRCIIIKSAGAQVAAIRAGRAHINFRYVSPAHRDNLVSAMGDKCRVQEIPMLIAKNVVINCEKKPFSDPRVRRALNLALDRWAASKALSKISSMKLVGARMRPGSEFAMTEEELTKVAGFSKDIEGSRREARRLLREAGVPEGFSFKIINRSEGDYEVAGVWLIDQWRQIGLDVKQEFQELGQYMKSILGGNYQLALESISESLDEPSLLLTRVVSFDKNPNNVCRYIDRVLDDLFEKQSRTMDPVERKQLIKKFEIRLIDEMAYTFPVLWNLRIVVHSAKLKGWNIMPHHSLNVDLANVWLSED